MALIIVLQNDKSGPDDAANYNVTVCVNEHIIERTRIEGHNRKDDWRMLVRRLAGPRIGETLVRETVAWLQNHVAAKATKGSPGWDAYMEGQQDMADAVLEHLIAGQAHPPTSSKFDHNHPLCDACVEYEMALQAAEKKLSGLWT